LGLYLLEHPHHTFANPLRKFNAGQNSVASDTVLEERLALPLQAMYPDYVLILIGTNDMQAMVRPKDDGDIHSVHQAIASGTDITELSRQCTTAVLEQIVTQCNNDRLASVPLYEVLEGIIEKKSGKKAPSWLNLFDHW
jgi:lysophospholipase L1-like esterase